MDGSEDALSLLNIERTVIERLERLDVSSAEEYLTRARRIVQSLQDKIDTARHELSDLVAKAAAAEDTASLRLVNSQVVSVASELFLSLHSVPMVQEFCTTARGAIAERALELSHRELYFSGTTCEIAVTLLAVGSEGRREQLLFTDQDYLFLLARHETQESKDSRSDEEIDDYLGMLGSVFVAKLEEAGISRCSGGIMPVNDDWRGSQQQWQDRLDTMLRFERNDWEKNIFSLIALMDVRVICGDREIGVAFGNNVRSLVRDNPEAMRHMARVVSSMKLSRGFLRRFVLDAEGAHQGEFNFKLLALMPLVMCIRVLAVNVGIEETSTLERIELLRAGGLLTDRLATELTSAYHVITGHRILGQIKRLKRIIDDDCYINPNELARSERETLRTAIGTIEELQNMVRSRFSMANSVDRIITPNR